MEWEITYCTYVICHLRNEGTSLESSWLKKVQLYRLKGGKESSDQPVDSPSGEQSAKWEEEEVAIPKEKATVRKQGGSLHLHTHKPRAPSHSQAPGQQVWGTFTLHISPYQLCQMGYWRVDTEPAWKLRNSSAPVAQKAPLAALAPLETLEQQQLTSSDTEQPAQPRTADAPSWGSLALPVPCVFSNSKMKKHYPWLQVKSSKLSPAHVLNTLLWVCLLYLDCFCCFAFPSQNLQQDVKQDVCETTKPKLYRYLYYSDPEIDSKRQNISIK